MLSHYMGSRMTHNLTFPIMLGAAEETTRLAQNVASARDGIFRGIDELREGRKTDGRLHIAGSAAGGIKVAGGSIAKIAKMTGHDRVSKFSQSVSDGAAVFGGAVKGAEGMSEIVRLAGVEPNEQQSDEDSREQRMPAFYKLLDSGEEITHGLIHLGLVREMEHQQVSDAFGGSKKAFQGMEKIVFGTGNRENSTYQRVRDLADGTQLLSTGSAKLFQAAGYHRGMKVARKIGYGAGALGGVLQMGKGAYDLHHFNTETDDNQSDEDSRRQRENAEQDIYSGIFRTIDGIQGLYQQDEGSEEEEEKKEEEGKKE